MASVGVGHIEVPVTSDVLLVDRRAALRFGGQAGASATPWLLGFLELFSDTRARARAGSERGPQSSLATWWRSSIGLRHVDAHRRLARSLFLRSFAQLAQVHRARTGSSLPFHDQGASRCDSAAARLLRFGTSSDQPLSPFHRTLRAANGLLAYSALLLGCSAAASELPFWACTRFSRAQAFFSVCSPHRRWVARVLFHPI